MPRSSLTDTQDRLRCQCLAPKTAKWKSEPDDEDFERSARYCFVTGISAESQSDYTIEGLTPARHGTSELMVDNNAREEVRFTLAVRQIPTTLLKVAGFTR
jgi:hypothetical protein